MPAMLSPMPASPAALFASASPPPLSRWFKSRAPSRRDSASPSPSNPRPSWSAFRHSLKFPSLTVEKIMNTQNNNGQSGTDFGPLIYSYTRAQAVADGLQVDVTKTAQEAGIKFPVFLTRTVFDSFVTVPEGVTGQDEAGRLWDIVWMLRFGILRSRPGVDRIPVAFYVRNDNRAARLVKLVATCGALDMDDPQPAITLMMPDED